MLFLFCCVDVLVFFFLKEGFGLVVLEVMVSGVLVVVLCIVFFMEYFDGDCCVWVDLYDLVLMVVGIVYVLVLVVWFGLIVVGLEVCVCFLWQCLVCWYVELYVDFICCQFVVVLF